MDTVDFARATGELRPPARPTRTDMPAARRHTKGSSFSVLEEAFSLVWWEVSPRPAGEGPGGAPVM